jgi:hypothetical protein
MMLLLVLDVLDAGTPADKGVVQEFERCAQECEHELFALLLPTHVGGSLTSLQFDSSLPAAVGKVGWRSWQVVGETCLSKPHRHQWLWLFGWTGLLGVK